MRERTVAVVGGGAWGRALSAAAARAGNDVVLYSRRAPRELGELEQAGAGLPGNIKRVRTLAEATEDARLIVFAVPPAAARTVARELGDHLDGSHYVLHGVRGLADAPRDGHPGLETISDILRDETPVRRTGALGGPALANDLLHGRPSVLVAASRFPEVTEAAIRAFGSATLRVYPTNDLRGLEWASALVGCLTIAVGYAQALDVSPGLVAALISRSVGEASRITAAAGGDERTLFGLAGYGDLLASISQSERPEVVVGRALAKGAGREEATRAAALRVDALELIPRVSRWADDHHVRAPIFRALTAGLVEGRRADAILQELMTLPVQHGA